MRHGNGYRKLGRLSAHRRALLRNMATSLILNERMETTIPKAKTIRPIVEKLITLGRKRTGDLHAIRQVGQYLFDKDATHKVFTSLAERFKERPGGYLRIIRLGTRFGDGAEMASIEFVDYKPGEKTEVAPVVKKSSNKPKIDKVKKPAAVVTKAPKVKVSEKGGKVSAQKSKKSGSGKARTTSGG